MAEEFNQTHLRTEQIIDKLLPRDELENFYVELASLDSSVKKEWPATLRFQPDLISSWYLLAAPSAKEDKFLCEAEIGLMESIVARNLSQSGRMTIRVLYKDSAPPFRISVEGNRICELQVRGARTLTAEECHLLIPQTKTYSDKINTVRLLSSVEHANLMTRFRLTGKYYSRLSEKP